MQDRPVHLLRRPVPPALEEVGVRRRRGREDPRPEGRAVQRDAGIQEDLAAAQHPAGGPRGGPVHRGAAHAGAGTDRRRAGQDGARHRARRGGPGPRRPAAPRLHRHRPEPQMGGRPAPTCRPGRGSATRRSSWTCSPAGSSAGPPAAAWTPTSCSAPWNTRSRRARNAGARTWRGWCTTATTDRSTCPSPTPDDSSKRGPGASAGAVGSSYDNAAAEALNKSYKRELVWRDGPWKGRDDPGNRDRQMGGLVQPHPPPPHQRRRPPTHNRRTPLQSQPHHHPTHHRIINPPQNPGLSRRVWSVCANGAGVVGVWAEDLLGRCIEHCR